MGGDPNQLTTFQPMNLCVQKGDFIGLSTEGGFAPTFYPQGTPFQIYSNVGGSSLDFFSMHNGVMNGAQFTGSGLSGVELLMQETVSESAQAEGLCGGGG